MLKLHIFVCFSPSTSLLHLSLVTCMWETSYKPFFGKIAQAPHYTNLVGTQVKNFKKIN